MDNSYDEFFYQLRISESGNNYSIVNSLGFLGAYQFGEAALVDLGFVSNDGSPYDNQFDGVFYGKYNVHDVVDFLTDPQAQDNAAEEWFDLIWRRIRFFDLEFYDGQTLNGIALTASGMIAGAHLGGVGGIKDLIESGGFVSAEDANGTGVADYIQRFAGYEVPSFFLNNLEKDNSITGAAGEDVLSGHDGDDQLYGFGGADQLVGGNGSDVLEGGAGNDLLFGDQSVSVPEFVAEFL